jgi:hypothetical protein
MDLTEAQWKRLSSEGWTPGTWARLHKVQRQRDAARERLSEIETTPTDTTTPPPAPPAPKKDDTVTAPANPPTATPPTTPATDPTLAALQEQMAQMKAMLAASESARMKAEATAALASQGIQDKAVQDFLLAQHGATKDAPAFGEWLETAKAHPIYSRLLTPPTEAPAAPPAPGGPQRPPPAPSAPHQHTKTPPPPGPSAFSDEAVKRMSWADRQKYAAEIARAAAAEGEITLTDSLKKRLNMA